MKRMIPLALVCLLAAPLYAQKDYQHDPGPSARESRQAWAEATKGVNLALGRPVTFSIRPAYELTMDDGDATDLTDGKLSVRTDDRIWFSKDAVGWRNADRGVNLLLDLGSQQPVGTVAIRLLGGGEQRILLYPSLIKVFGSDDGRVFHELSSLQLVNSGEKELAEQQPDKYIYLPQTGTAVVSTFVLKVHRRMRYVGVTLKGASGDVYTDQLAVMKDTAEDVPGMEGLPPSQFIVRGIAMEPRQKDVVITTNIQTPNHFVVVDARSDANKERPLLFYMDLPRGVSVVRTDRGTAKRQSSPDHLNRWVLENFYDPKRGDLAEVGDLWLTLDGAGKLPPDATLTISSDDPDSADNVITARVTTVVIPTVGDDHLLDVSLAWYHEKEAAKFPNFYNAFRQMGFNRMATFPYWSHTREEVRAMVDIVAKARQRGFRIIYNDSPFHVMSTNHKDEGEIYNQIDGKPGKYLCPTYTGKFYQEEMKRIGDNARLIHPDEVFYDIEIWYYAVQEARQCSRCQAAFKASGMTDWDRFMFDQGTRQMRDMFDATKGTAPDGGNPVSGLYNVHAANPLYELIHDFNAIYPKYVQIAMPSLYVQGDAQRVHDVVRENYNLTKSRNIIPWLSPGTYGEFPSYKLQQMILETLANGARGFTYFWYGDFDPMDWYYHANALKLIAPYQQVLNDGMQVEMAGSNKQLTYSAFGTDRQAVVLVGNYTKTPSDTTGLTFGGRKVASVHDAMSGRDLEVSELEHLQVQADQQRLLLVRFE